MGIYLSPIQHITGFGEHAVFLRHLDGRIVRYYPDDREPVIIDYAYQGGELYAVDISDNNFEFYARQINHIKYPAGYSIPVSGFSNEFLMVGGAKADENDAFIWVFGFGGAPSGFLAFRALQYDLTGNLVSENSYTAPSDNYPYPNVNASFYRAVKIRDYLIAFSEKGTKTRKWLAIFDDADYSLIHDIPLADDYTSVRLASLADVFFFSIGDDPVDYGFDGSVIEYGTPVIRAYGSNGQLLGELLLDEIQELASSHTGIIVDIAVTYQHLYLWVFETHLVNGFAVIDARRRYVYPITIDRDAQQQLVGVQFGALAHVQNMLYTPSEDPFTIDRYFSATAYQYPPP